MSHNINMNQGTPQTAVSLYGGDSSMDDFPILKAFQQYIDAEQSRARKRMVSLCIFFGILICIVIAVFMVMLHDISRRNQTLNDRLVEYAMRDRDHSVATVQPIAPQVIQPASVSSAQEDALRAMTETLVALQRQINEQRERSERKAAEVKQAEELSSQKQDAESVALELREKLSAERIARERAALDAERKSLEAEKERLHQTEIEQHRRRLYPEYYGERPNDSTVVATGRPAPEAVQKPDIAEKKSDIQPEFSDEDIAEILREADASAEEETDANASTNAEVAPQPSSATNDIDDAIEYFKDDEYQVPVSVNGKTIQWKVPVRD